MRPDAIRAQRAWEIREAARAWRAAGAINASAQAAIDVAHPDDRVRVGPVFRVLLFVAAAAAVIAAAGLVDILSGWRFGPTALALGAVCVALTEWQTAWLRRSGGGAEAATAFAAVVLLAFGFLDSRVFPFTEATVYVTLAALFAVAAFRWGVSLFGLFAAVFAFALFTTLPFARLWWIGTAAFAIPLLLRGSRSIRVAPAHRRALTEALVVALAALYAALNVALMDDGWLLDHATALAATPARPSTSLRVCGIVGTALLPPLFIWWGIRGSLRGSQSGAIPRPRPVLFRMGLVMAVGLVITIRYYFRILPVWFAVTVGGLVLLAAALLLRRWLDAAPSGERGGFTAQPLFESERGRRLVELVVAAAAVPQAATPQAAQPAFGGGTSGGGGASGTLPSN